MKNLKKLIFVLVIFGIGLIKVNAASALINVTTNKSSVVVGNTVTVTVKVSSTVALGAWEFDLSYNSSLLRLTNGDGNIVDYVSSNNVKTKTYTYTFKALKSGTATVGVSNYSVLDFNEDKMSTTAKSTSIKIITQEQLQQSYSKNNYLKSLTVDKGSLSPSFNKDTLEYTLELENGTEKLVVGASVEDAKAKLSGTGTISVSEGSNKITIKVTAENGNVKNYVINAIVKELEPVNVVIDGKDYSVVRKEGVIDPPKNYDKSTTVINGTEVLSYKSSITGYTLVALKDSEGNIAYYKYEDDKFTLYHEISFNNINVIILDFNNKIIPNNYFKTTIGINNEEITVYKLDESSDYSLIYGMNTETGDKNLYIYDNVENTIQRYNNEEVKLVNEKINEYRKIIIGLIIAIGVLIVGFIIGSIIRDKKRHKAILKAKMSKEKVME